MVNLRGSGIISKLTMNSLIATLLQLTTSLLLVAKQSDTMPLAAREGIVGVAGRAIQLSTQALMEIPPGFVQIKNNGIWPTAADLGNSLYLDARGKYVPFGQSVQALYSYSSFGDINNDGFDDAFAVVKRSLSGGGYEYALAAMLNQGNVLFNIDDATLGSSIEIYSHHVVNGALDIDMSESGLARKTRHYGLLGNQIVSF